MGCLFERQALELIYNNLKNSGRYHLTHLAPMGSVNNNKNNIILEQKITRKVLIRHIEDIRNLLTTDYGLPVISNFPFSLII